ncbi:FadR/GntR family transcriptional regulator [Streptacidiphilus jiangxiensis]|uniref:DNA-binding transcriptional regulator, FadR family n=1 Tax=Streptacidiphilus jiangxiensis TaxID=235985 RepID=A0A1H7KM61_STRJI|nr:FadR/GntR family transcriptional regulator [Streptacidiphilus jiangxiensis]SEK87921.1 DNA-binding transcriptional regulator, FadR family [Streptacidiphilus jiangxiensis]
MLFTKFLKGARAIADKGDVSTVAHPTMPPAQMTSTQLDRFPVGASHSSAPGVSHATSGAALHWDSSDPDLGRVGRRAAGSRGRGLHGQLVQQLGQMIVSGDLGADRPLVPEEIGQRFEVSRTVVRESLRVLEAKGLVSARPNVGTRVRPVSDWNLLDPDIIEWRAFGPQREDQRRELFELRWAIEPLAARLAAGHGRDESRQRMHDMTEIMGHAAAQGDALTYNRADAEFHAVLMELAGNKMLEHLAGIVGSALQVSGGPVTACDRPSEPSVGLHVRLVDALGTGDGTAAEAAMRSLLMVHPEVDPLVPGPREH